MSENQRTKDVVNSDLQRVFKLGQTISGQIRNLPGEENMEKRQLLLDKLKQLSTAEEALNNEFAQLVEQEKQPELERISSLRKELQKGRFPSFYEAAQGGADIILSQDLPKNQPDPTKSKERQRELIGQIYNAPPSEGGMASEQLPAGVRFGVGALATPESELEYLKRTYPDANITPMSVGNSTEFLIKTKDNKTFTTLDMGLAGFGGAALVEAPIVAGSTAAGIAAALATKSPVAGTATATGTEAVLGTTADMITRAALGMPQNASTTGEIVMRRGTQAAIGGGLGIVGDVGIPRLAKFRTPTGTANEFMEQFAGPVQRTGIPMPPGAQFGPRGLEGAQELAGDFPTSRLGGQFRTRQLNLFERFQPIRDLAQRSPGDYANIALNQAQQRRALATRIAQNTNQNEQIVEGAVDRLIYRDRLLQPSGKSNIDTLGETLRETVLAAEERVIKDKDKLYDELFDSADNAGFSVTPREMLDQVLSLKRQANISNARDASAVNSVIQRLEARVDAPGKLARLQSYANALTRNGRNVPERTIREIADLQNLARPLNARDFDEFIKAFSEARPDNMVSGASKDVFGRDIAEGLSTYRINVYDSLQTTLPSGRSGTVGDLFREVSQKVAERQTFEENLLGSILKEAAGEQSKSPRVIANAVMKDPFNMERVLQAARNLEATDQTKAGITKNLQEMMQSQYLDEMKNRSRGSISQLDYDQGTLNVLFGPESKRIGRAIETLNENLKTVKGVNISDITRDDLMKLSSALSKQERNQLSQQIVKREQLKKLEEDLAASEIFKAAKKGNFDNIDPDILSSSIYSDKVSVRDVATAMEQLNKMSPNARNMYRSDFTRFMLDRYPSKTTTTAPPFGELFNYNKFLDDYGTPTAPTPLGVKINYILGKEKATEIYDIAKLSQGYKIKDTAPTEMNPRIVMSSGNVKNFMGISFLAPIGKLTTKAQNRMLAEGLANGSSSNRLRSALARNALPGDVNEAYLEMFKSAFKTRQGVTSLVRMAEGDPEFSAELQQAAKDFEEQEQAGFNARSAKLMEGANQSQQKQNLNPAPR